MFRDTVKRTHGWAYPARTVGDGVEITLKHDGGIPASQDDNRHSDFKQSLRVEFSRQLRRLWRQGLLKEFYEAGLPVVSHTQPRQWCCVPDDPDKHPFFRVQVCGFSAIPMVSWHNMLGCDLDFSFLGDERGIIDLDNQIKTVFDALRMPHQPNEVPGHMFGKGDDLFCLLEDDAIVKRFCVESRFGGGGSPPDEELFIKARVYPSHGTCHPALDRFR